MTETSGLLILEQPLAHPAMLKIAQDEILFIGELYIGLPSENKNLCVFLQDRLIICEELIPTESQCIIQGTSFMIKFCFDLKFEAIYCSEKILSSNIMGVRLLQKNHKDFEFYFTDKINDKIHILQILRKFLVQKGFHEMFKPLKKLGSGTFATVFQVKRYEDGKKFAVKAFSKNHLFSSPRGKQSLINQLNVLRCLNHKNVMRLQGVFESDNSLYVLLQLINGKHFFNALKHMENIFFTPAQTQKFMRNLLEGLNHIHSQRLMHRDLKPENIMLRNGNFEDPVIVDFGLGTNCDVPQYLFYRCGTPGYIAPQIIALRDNKKHVEPTCDIFSAGAIFHIMLTGRVLFEGNEFDQVYEKNKRLQYTIDPQQIAAKSKSTEAYNLLVKMLEKNPEERITAEQALSHQYFKNMKQEGFCSPLHTQIGENQQQSYMAPKIIKF